ncbi:MAG TPA: hypothetical protein VFA66_00270, partial [Gaiellaceae bacterium]|nr:hypothetical protein [Gaiellaceae bacterium]
MAERQILAVGGDPWSGLHDYALTLAGPSPRALWVGTATAEDPDLTLRVYDALRGRVADLQRVEFFPWPRADLRELVLSRDVIV